MRSEETTVEAYLGSLPEDRRAAIEAVREVVLERLPEGIEETMRWGMITYEVPLSTYPDTYNGQPLMYAALASQKGNMAVYLSHVYASEEAKERFVAAYRATGKRLDMGKSCVRFKRLEDLPLPVIGEAIGAADLSTFVRAYEAGRAAAKGGKKSPAKKSRAKKAPKKR